ncbi:DUF4331 family protein [Actinacidiphila sp. ITFR-21]|uniref:DUF4331 family protein n=1 Tax=Actinacidiphila sp. ITFR-21 TaxID=3075199 RepID=UPI00288BB93F|nr:DUF4331 family protein [Streptomyces sp. ITFR-21]WNI16455.1 DUF4331 family protein [Streptomyces sp. ITFR-21]
MAGDPFWIEPDVLHAVGHAFQDGGRIDLGGWQPEKATNFFAGQTVHSTVLELPDAELLPVAGADRRTGVWSLASLATDAGGWRPINRAGLPVIHPLFAQYDEDLGDRLNANHPSRDVELYGAALTEPVASVVRAYGTSAHPDAYARMVVAAFLPNLPPYTLGTAASFGFAGWNGRTMTDNAPDVVFSFAANTPVTLALTKDAVVAKPSDVFPYVPPTP